MVAPPAKNVNQTIDGSTVMVMTVDGIPDAYMYESSIASVTLVESLLTPSIHTTVEVQDPVYWAPDGQVKDLNRYKGKTLAFNLYKKDLDASLEVNQVIYRIDNRKLMNMQVEGYQIHAIDNDTLINATGRMARAWVCKTPSTIVEDALKCIGATHMNIESSGPPRNYNATNIYPYQVISEQAEVALANGTDPSFVHFMTFEDTTGRHNFRSLANMAKQGSVANYIWNEKGQNEGGLPNPFSIMSYEFPCDFDLLSDLMNGVNNSSSIIENVQNGIVSLFGSQDMGCGTGAGLTKYALTDFGSSDGCNVATEKYIHLRQARMSLLEQDKIGLRITVPFNPNLHVGQVITATFESKNKDTLGQLEYGSGDYLICSLSHNYKAGGFGTTTLDCVAETVAAGEL
jgi:hypothetical protein